MTTRNDLDERLAEQIDWIYASAERFDAGVTSEAKRIATVIRTLVHSTSASISLLHQLGMQESMTWYSMIKPVPAESPSGTGGLWISVPQEPGFRPILGRALFTSSFESWWREPIVAITAGSLSRADLVLQTVNFDGGAHIDPKLPDAYKSLSRDGGLHPLRINSAGNTYPDSSSPVPAAIRTIASELVQSIDAVEW